MLPRICSSTMPILTAENYANEIRMVPRARIDRETTPTVALIRVNFIIDAGHVVDQKGKITAFEIGRDSPTLCRHVAAGRYNEARKSRQGSCHRPSPWLDQIVTIWNLSWPTAFQNPAILWCNTRRINYRSHLNSRRINRKPSTRLSITDFLVAYL